MSTALPSDLRLWRTCSPIRTPWAGRVDAAGYALYFSRFAHTGAREGGRHCNPARRHLWIPRPNFDEVFVIAAQSARAGRGRWRNRRGAIWHGYRMRSRSAPRKFPPGVDTPQDSLSPRSVRRMRPRGGKIKLRLICSVRPARPRVRSRVPLQALRHPADPPETLLARRQSRQASRIGLAGEKGDGHGALGPTNIIIGLVKGGGASSISTATRDL